MKNLLLLLSLIAVSAYAMDMSNNPIKRKRDQFYEHDLLTAVRLADANRVRELVERVPRNEVRVALNFARQELQAAQNDPQRVQKLERIIELLDFSLDT